MKIVQTVMMMVYIIPNRIVMNRETPRVTIDQFNIVMILERL